MAERDEVVRRRGTASCSATGTPRARTDRARPAGAPSAAPPSAATAARRRPVRRRTKVPTLDLSERELVARHLRHAGRGPLRAPAAQDGAATPPTRCSGCASCASGSAQLDDLAFHYELARDHHRAARRPHPLHRARPASRARPPCCPSSSSRSGSRPTRYVVSKVADDPALVPDRQLRARRGAAAGGTPCPSTWPSTVQADQETGGRPDSRRARALESLTLRALQFAPPPAEHWVIIGYVDRQGRRARGPLRLAGGVAAAGPHGRPAAGRGRAGLRHRLRRPRCAAA